jgi:hypothetical protein
MSKVTLLVIDMQKNCKEATPCKASFEKAVEYINRIHLLRSVVSYEALEYFL